MALATYSFGFNVDTEGYVGTAGTSATLTRDATNGRLQTRVAGRSKTGDSYWEWTGTWEQLGVPAGSVVTNVAIAGATVGCTEYTTAGSGNQSGPYELYTGAGALIGQLFAGKAWTAIGSYTAPAQPALSVPSAQQASNASIKLRLKSHLVTAASSSAAVTVYDDAINVQVTYKAPLAAPTGLVATPGDARVDLTWNAVPNATGYTVKYWPTATPASYGQMDVTGTSAGFTAMTNGTEYTFQVMANPDPASTSYVSSPYSATVAATPVAATEIHTTSGTAALTLSASAVAGKVATTAGTAALTLSASATTAVVLPEIHTTTSGGTPAYQRGINDSGGEFGDPRTGTYDSGYHYDGQATFDYLAGRGHKVIRLPFRWEHLQPTLGAALDSTELSRLQAVVGRIQTAGMRAILDLHNYARYTTSDGVERTLGDGTLTQAHLVDLWDRVAAAFAGNAGLYAYGIMNEPHDLAAQPGSFSGTTRYDWNDGTVQSWTGDTATAANVGGALRVSGTATAGYFNLRKDDAGAMRGGALAGDVLRTVITLAAGTPGTWKALPQWQNQSYSWRNGSTTYKRVSDGAAVTGLIAGVAVEVITDFSSDPITNPRAFAIQVEANDATAGAVSFDMDDYGQGTIAAGASGAQVWEQASQAALDQIRTHDTAAVVLVPGYAYSGAQSWSTNHPAPWITDATGLFAYEAHYYPDTDHNGVFDVSYDTELANATGAGYTDVADRATQDLAVFTDWLAAGSVDGFIGEMGWPKTDSRWNTVGEAMYAHLDAASVGATYWATGEWWGTGYDLSAYDTAGGGSVSTPTQQATVLEAHLTPPAGATPVTLSASAVTSKILPEIHTTSGTAAITLSASAQSGKAATTAGTAALTLTATGTEGTTRTTAGTAAVILSANATAAAILPEVHTTAGTATVTLSATATVNSTEAHYTTGTAALTLGASAATQSSHTEAGTAALTLSALAAVSTARTTTGTAGLTLSASATNTATETHTTVGTAALALGATASSSSTRATAGTAALVLGESAVAGKTAAVAGTAPLTLAAAGAVSTTRMTAAGALVTLDATAVTAVVFFQHHMLLPTTAVVRGPAGTATLRVVAPGTAQVAAEVTGTATLAARPAGTATVAAEILASATVKPGTSGTAILEPTAVGTATLTQE